MLTFSMHQFQKRVPLTISRGTRTHSAMYWLRWTEEGVEGWGEVVPFAIDDQPQTEAVLEAALAEHQPWLARASAWDRVAVEQALWQKGAPSALIAGVTMAFHDWLGKRLEQPLWRLLGLAPVGPLTSVTIGLAPPEVAARRVTQWLEVGDFRAFKIKLGSPAGMAADQAMFAAVQAAIPSGARVSVDANGGWGLDTAAQMASWLAERGVDHLEQPLPRGSERALSTLQRQSPLPVIVDESCCTSADIPALAGTVAGINIKLMKCGGLDEALRMIATARAHGLKVLLGCYGNTALANTAAAQLGALVDYLDLDSHLNLVDDPFRGGRVADGRIHLGTSPGLGLSHEHASS